MNENTEKLIRELADKLGTTGDHLWAVLVKQVPIAAFCSSLVGLALLIALIAIGFGCYKWVRNAASSDDEMEVLFSSIVILLISGVAIALCGSGIVLCFQDVLTAIYNPEYAALQSVITHLK